jgi:hypothetical protein
MDFFESYLEMETGVAAARENFDRRTEAAVTGRVIKWPKTNFTSEMP